MLSLGLGSFVEGSQCLASSNVVKHPTVSTPLDLEHELQTPIVSQIVTKIAPLTMLVSAYISSECVL